MKITQNDFDNVSDILSLTDATVDVDFQIDIIRKDW